MKQVFKTVFPIVLLYIILGFAVVMAVSLPERTETGVLPPFTASFRFMQAFIRYTGLFPALAAAGLLTGYATAFRKLVPESVGRWSPKLFSVLKNAFLLCVLCIGLYVLLSEGAAPVLKNRSGDLLSKSGSYQDYLALAQAETENGNYRAALSNAEAALGIWEESPEASRAAEQARLLLAGTGDGIPEEEEPAQENPEAPGEAGYHAFELLELAREAEARTDFYNAHYYATLAWRMFDAGDPNKEAAMRLASGAWNRITGALDGIRAEPQRAHYAKKMRGYAAIQAGDFLTAYYLFLEMQDGQRQAAQGTDPDIARFLAVARQGILRSFFFTQETENLALFEQTADVFFTLQNGSGGTDAVLLRGVSRRRGEDGTDCAYLRDFELARFSAAGGLEFHIAVPYAKMFSFAGTNPDEEPRPELLLTAVDQDSPDGIIRPRVVAGTFPPPDSVPDSVLVLDMPYTDMTLLLATAADPDLMTVPELLAFAQKSESYGLKRDVYLAEFLRRAADPFVVFITMTFILTWAWKFRLRKNRPLSAWWIFFMPLVPAVCAYLLDTARYALGLFAAFFAVRIPAFSVPAMLGVILAGFLTASVYFFSQRSD